MNPLARTLAIISALGCIAFAGCKPADPAPRPKESNPGNRRSITIGVSLMNLSSEFIVMINAAIEKKAHELGVKLLVNDAQRSPERQVQQVESFVAQKVDAIILNPCEVEASSPAVDKALAAGIPESRLLIPADGETLEL
jgi:inositol transport system substrate-binding protein